MRHQVAAATSGWEVSSQRRIFSFSLQASESSNPPPSRRRGWGCPYHIETLAVCQIVWSTTVQVITNSRPTRVLAGGGRWWMGGLGSTAACRVGLLCRALAGTGGQRPVNSMLHHDGMHASQIPRVQGGGLPPRTLPACACEHAVQARRATNREPGAPAAPSSDLTILRYIV